MSKEEIWKPIPELRAPVPSVENWVKMLTAGNAVMTVVSARSGARFTFRFSRPSERRAGQFRGVRPIYCSILGGPDTERSWTYLGVLWPNENRRWNYSHSPKSMAAVGHEAALFLTWMAMRLPAAPEAVWGRTEWWHEGRCGRCGRRLTVPGSIKTGFGPDCSVIVFGKS